MTSLLYIVAQEAANVKLACHTKTRGNFRSLKEPELEAHQSRKAGSDEIY
jgi:hypothetical protein